MVLADFRSQFPEFASTATYPDAQVNFWASIAESFVNEDVWGANYTFGVKLYVAHEITLATQNVQSAANGAAPGGQGGVATAKAVGGVNVTYDANTTSEKDAGWWNLTNYGRQFIRIARMMGAGVVQL